MECWLQQQKMQSHMLMKPDMLLKHDRTEKIGIRQEHRQKLK